MDTSQLEKSAENLISHKLQRNEILVAKPQFDVKGTDLLAFSEMKDGIKFCRLQSKGRSLASTNSSSVKISPDYVSYGFVVFLYLEFNETDQDLYVFFAADIEQWKTNSKGEYQLSISASTAKKNLEFYKFDSSKATLIKNIIKNAEVSGEFKRLIYGKINVTLEDATCSATGTVGEVPKNA